MRRWRRGLALAGLLLLAYGVLRLVSQNSVRDLLSIALWLAAAVAIHDGLVAPGLIGAGRVLTLVPPRARRYLQVGLVVGAVLTVVAVPLIHREGTQPPSKTLLVHDYSARLTVLLALVAAVSLTAYAVQVVRSRSRGPASGHAPPTPPVDSRTTRS